MTNTRKRERHHDTRHPQGVCEKPARRGMGFRPIHHRQDADATKAYGQDARATPHTPSQSIDRLREAARALDKAYRPFLAQLKDIQASLALDLTPAGVKAAQPAFEKARQSAADVKQQIASFIGTIDQVLAVSPPSQ